MRYYLVTFIREGLTVRLGATSAAEAMRGIVAMRRDGWRIDSIERGTEHIELDELKSDAAAARNASR